MRVDYGELARMCDASDMYGAYASWPDAVVEGHTAVRVRGSPAGGERVAFAAMGGSASAPEVLSEWVGGWRPLFIPVIKDADLPPYIGEGWTLVCVSARGNTEEVLHLAAQAAGRGGGVVGISSGGRLEELCLRGGWPHIKVPYRHSPRASFPYLLDGCLAALESLGFLDGTAKLVRRVSEVWREALERGGIDGPPDSTPKKVASHVHNRLAACYASPTCLSVARRFKNSMNENAKAPVLVSSLPDAAHNEMEVVISSPQIAPILLSLPTDGSGTRRILQAVEAMLQERGVGYLGITPSPRPLPPEEHQLVSRLELLYELELASLYSALLRRVDPTPVPASTAYRTHLGRLAD